LLNHRISRNCPEQTFVWTSHFYTKLATKGIDEVANWSKRTNIFNKTLIFIPINEGEHWSLCVVVNPGCILEHNATVESAMSFHDEQKCPFMVLFDSLKYHDADEIGKNIKGWLNWEWRKSKCSTGTVGEGGSATPPFSQPFSHLFRLHQPKGMSTFAVHVFHNKQSNLPTNLICVSVKYLRREIQSIAVFSSAGTPLE
jgi:hypothetical protein